MTRFAAVRRACARRVKQMAPSSGRWLDMLDQSGQHARKVMEMLSGNAAAQSEIVASWKRCVSLHNLSPERDVHTEIMT